MIGISRSLVLGELLAREGAWDETRVVPARGGLGEAFKQESSSNKHQRFHHHSSRLIPPSLPPRRRRRRRRTIRRRCWLRVARLRLNTHLLFSSFSFSDYIEFRTFFFTSSVWRAQWKWKPLIIIGKWKLLPVSGLFSWKPNRKW